MGNFGLHWLYFGFYVILQQKQKKNKKQNKKCWINSFQNNLTAYETSSHV